MSRIVENIEAMSEADLKAWCFQQTDLASYMVDRIQAAAELMNWIVSSPSNAQRSQATPLSEQARLELLRITIKFAEDNFNFNKKGIESSQIISKCYLALAEAVSIDIFPLPMSGISERAFSLLGSVDEKISAIEKMLRSLGCVFSPQETGHSDNSTHPFKDRNTHNSTPSSNETHPTDSQSTGRDESVADDGFCSPTDAELQERGCPELIESRAVRFLCNLPDTELKLISCDGMSRWLQAMLVRLAGDELHRRGGA